MQQPVDLSPEAIASRDREQRLKDAIAWATSMQRAFKGLSGSVSRADRAMQAIAKYNLESDR